MPSNKSVDIELTTIGIIPSIIRFLFALNEPDALGAGNVKTALLPDKSLIVLPFNESAVVFI